MLLLVLLSILITPILSNRVISVNYPPYPTIPEAPLNAQLLNELANIYYENTDHISNLEFLFVYVPVWVFNTLSKTEEDCDEVDRDDMLGLLYFSGYFGGLWLREMFKLENRPGPVSPALISPQIRSIIHNGLQAVDGNDPLNYTRSHVNTSVDTFGYNAGYMRIILDQPPSGLHNDPKWEFQYDPQKALFTKFETPLLDESIDEFHKWYNQLNNKHQFNAVKETYISIQATAYTRGTNLWNGRLNNNMNFDAETYEFLLESSSAFLEIARLDALSMTESVGLASEHIARSAALMDTIFATFGKAYSMGLLNNQYDSSPPFPIPCIVATF